MAENPTYLTPEGLQKLKEELAHLTNVRRPEIALQIQQAKGEGDISDSSGYEEAKNMQGFIEGRIAALEQMLRDTVMIDTTEISEKVILGSLVKVQEDGEQPEEYLLVGPAEADPVGGRISNESPLGRALMGKRAGDRVTIDAPSGQIRFRILEIN
ncbi:MAG: transcription elongation factor GreA [Chloroflexi bacterium]|nr:transcription elongation factor GreA [Chloroflexota bacterium]